MRSRIVMVVIGAGLSCAQPPSPPAPPPESIAGVWEGRLVHDSASHLLRAALQHDSTGFHGSLDLPDQYAYGYTLKDLTIDGPTVKFTFPDVLPPSAFDGTFDGDRISGTFASPAGPDTARGTFELSRRPGEAKPYGSEPVRFQNGDVPLRGTLFVPNTKGPHPAVVLLHGSGPQTRESYIRYFADQFARKGIAALIYDKRTTGRPDSTLVPQGSGTLGDFANDAAFAVRYLRARPDAIDPRRIGLWGLSQGAWVVPMTAERIEGVAFLVLLSGGGVTPARQELYDDEVKLKTRGFSSAQIQRATSLLKLANIYVRTHADSDWNRFQSELARARQEPWFSSLDRFPLILPRESPAWTDLDIDYDPVALLERLRIPVLVILGADDELTPAAETARIMRTALESAGNPDYTVRVIPRADHGLWVTSGSGGAGAPGGSGGHSWLGQRPAKGWVDEMVAWVSARARRP